MTVKQLPPKLPPKRTPPAPTAEPPKSAKSFSTGVWQNDTCGEKVIIYGRSGIGKTTLANLAPKPIFVSVDDGLQSLVKHEQKPAIVNGIETFQDVRDALQQVSIFDKFETIIIDTATKLEELALNHVITTIPHEKGGYVKTIEGFGYGKGYRHIRDAMASVLPDLDRLVRNGKNVVLLCQNAAAERTNTSGENFLEDGPRLYHPKDKDSNSIRALYTEWANTIAKIDYYNLSVEDKKAAGTTDRAVFVQPEVYYIAKSRTIDEKVIAFADNNDDSFWQLLLGAK